jgi:Raf kinase inhibitor-like YbhB/YbcL family protein
VPGFGCLAISMLDVGGAMKPQTRSIKVQGRARRITIFALVFLPSLLVFVILWQLRSVAVQGQARSRLEVSSASFSDGGSIPRRYTCDGEDISPTLKWSHPPAGTKSFALVMDDPDAPANFTHWMVYDIPADVLELTEAASARGAMPKGSAEGTNDFNRPGYGGPCPPPGKPHHYVIHLYALDIRLDLPPGATRKRLDSAIERHRVAEVRIIGIYRRASQ